MNINTFYKSRTFFSIGLLISFFLPWVDLSLILSWKDLQFFTLSGFDIPVSLDRLKRMASFFGYSSNHILMLLNLFYILYLIPLVSVYNILMDFMHSKRSIILNEFGLGLVAAIFVIFIIFILNDVNSVKAKEMNIFQFLGIGFYTTVIFSILGLFSFSNGKSEVVELVQRGMEYQMRGMYPEAFACFQVAAEQGSLIAQKRLGEMYEKGLGIMKDVNIASEWYARAAALGDKEAKMRLEILNEEINR